MRHLAILALACSLTLASCKFFQDERAMERRSLPGNSSSEQSRDEDAQAPSPPSSKPSESMTPSAPPTINRNLAFGPQTCSINPATQKCYTIDASLLELSGIVASVQQKGLYWSQNDEGPPNLYALNIKGQIVAQLTLSGATNLDWEDLTLGPGPKPKVPYLYVGDIGDKGKTAGEVLVYRLEEPKFDTEKLGQTLMLSQWQRLRLAYGGNAVLDFETLFIDPVEGDLYFVQKGGYKVFRAKKADLDAATTDTLIPAEEVRNSGAWAVEPSSGNMSPQGDEIALRNETTAWIFKRAPGQSVAAALEKVALTMNLGPEFNGEAITYDADGLNLLTLSENTSKQADQPSPPQPISVYKRLDR